MALPVRRRESLQRQPSTGSAQPWVDPWAHLEDLHDRLGRLLTDPFAGPSELFGMNGRWSPPLDLEETDDAYLAEIDLPGVKKDDVNVELAGDTVHVHGEVKARERTGILRRQTRRVGVFDYAFTLPGEIDGEQVSASLNDGVLTIRVPKSGAARQSKITIPVN